MSSLFEKIVLCSPNIQLSMRDGFARVEVQDPTVDFGMVVWVRCRVLHDGLVHLVLGCVFAPEGTEDRGGGGRVGGFVGEGEGDFVDERFQADDVG